MQWKSFVRRELTALVVVVPALASAACDEVVVEPVPVSAITVTPQSLSLDLGDTAQLQASATDAAGHALPRQATWTSDDTSVATVDAGGMVQAVGPGSATISAAVGSVRGSAVIDVRDGPVVVLDPTSATLSAARRGSPSEEVTIAVTNGGPGVLTGLSASIAYAGDASGWLEARFEAGAAPTNLVLQADPGELEAGAYTAQVTVNGEAPAAGATMDVTFQVVTAPPAAPTGLSATVLSATAVRLDWTDASDDEESFRIERRSSFISSFTQVGSVQANVTTFTDASLQPASSYAFRVRACNAAGCSQYDGPVVVTTVAAQEVPEAPSALSATATSTSTIDVQWTDNASNEDEFRVERRPSSGSTFTLVGTNGADDTTFQDAGLAAATAYVYRVQACNSVGCSAFSAEASATTASLTVPPPPSGLSAEGVSSTGIRVRWSDNSDNESRFELQRRRASGGGGWDTIVQVDANVIEYLDGGLQPDTRYEYRVRACNEAGCSSYSNRDTGRTFEN